MQPKAAPGMVGPPNVPQDQHSISGYARVNLGHIIYNRVIKLCVRQIIPLITYTKKVLFLIVKVGDDVWMLCESLVPARVRADNLCEVRNEGTDSLCGVADEERVTDEERNCESLDDLDTLDDISTSAGTFSLLDFALTKVDFVLTRTDEERPTRS